MMQNEKNLKVLVCVTGSIAAYKACELVRLLVKRGAEVTVAMTESATHFVAPLTFEVLTGRPVRLKMFVAGVESDIDHIRLAQSVDCIVVAPATLNFISKLNQGIADDFISTVLSAATAPIVIAPAMNPVMWQNCKNLNAALFAPTERKIYWAAPGVGDFACGDTGEGRLMEPDHLVGEIYHAAALHSQSPSPWAGKKVLITAGPTLEPIDDIRIWTNRSSGKMGVALAKAATENGAQVKIIGPSLLPAAYLESASCEQIVVETAAQMLKAVEMNWHWCDALFKAAAVSDFKPSQVLSGKMSKENKETWACELNRTPDILKTVTSGRASQPDNKCIVGFSAQTDGDATIAQEKLQSKNMDYVVYNDVSLQSGNMGGDINSVTIWDTALHKTSLGPMAKSQLAYYILDVVAKHFTQEHGATS